MKSLPVVIASAVLGMIFGVAIGMGLQRWLSGETHRSDVLVVVTVQDLPRGTAITPDRLAARELPAECVEDDSVRVADLERVTGRVVSRSILAGTTLSYGDLDP